MTLICTLRLRQNSPCEILSFPQVQVTMSISARFADLFTTVASGTSRSASSCGTREQASSGGAAAAVVRGGASALPYRTKAPMPPGALSNGFRHPADCSIALATFNPPVHASSRPSGFTAGSRSGLPAGTSEPEASM